MKSELEKRLSEYFLIQKKSDGMHLAAFNQIVGKTAVHSTQWKLASMLKVAAILLLIAGPVYFIITHEKNKQGTSEPVTGGQPVWSVKMQSDYLPVSTTYLWTWTAPTDALLPQNSLPDEIRIRNAGDKE